MDLKIPRSILLGYLKGKEKTYLLFTPKGRLISGGSVELQFYPDVYISRARTAARSPFPSLP